MTSGMISNLSYCFHKTANLSLLMIRSSIWWNSLRRNSRTKSRWSQLANLWKTGTYTCSRSKQERRNQVRDPQCFLTAPTTPVKLSQSRWPSTSCSKCCMVTATVKSLSKASLRAALCISSPWSMSMESSISMKNKSTSNRTKSTCNARTWIRSGATQTCAVSIAKRALTWTETTDSLTVILERGRTLAHQLFQAFTPSLSQRPEQWETWFLSWCRSWNLCTTSTPMETFGPFPTVRLRITSWLKLIQCKSRFSTRYLPKRQNPRVSKREELLTCSATRLLATALIGSWPPLASLLCLQSLAPPIRTQKFSVWRTSH